MAFQAYDEKDLAVIVDSILAADGTGNKILYTADPRNARFDAITGCNNDTIAHTVEFFLDLAGKDCFLGGVVFPAGAGLGAVPAVDVLAALQVGAPAALFVVSGMHLYWHTTVAVTGAYLVGAMLVGGTF